MFSRNQLIVLLVVLMAIPAQCVLAASKLLGQLPRTSSVVEDFSVDRLRADLGRMPLHHIEGIWRYTTEKTEIAIIRPVCLEGCDLAAGGVDEGCYYIVLTGSADRSLRPGTVMGVVIPSAKSGVYEARIYTRKAASLMYDPRKFTLRLSDDDSRLVFDKKKSEFSVNLWHFVPYLWRYSVRRNVSAPAVSGCIRVYPEPELPLEPRYL